MRKPDREIYQPGGRRSQVHKETGVSKELDGDRRREEEVSGKSAETLAKCEKEEKRRNRRGKDGRKKQDSKGNVDSSTNKNENNVESITDKVSSLHLESESKDGGGQDGTNRRKPNGEGRRSQAGGGNEMTGEDKKKERGNGKSRAGREKGNNQVSAKKEEREGGGKPSEADQPEGKKQRNVGGKEVSRDQNMNHEKQGNRPKEKGRPSERTDSNRVNSASKRYSQSDIRRPRNRTYSTSSASSGTSMDGLAEAERLRGEGKQLAARATERTTGQKEFIRGSQGRPRRRTARTLSSTDSLEENEVWEREDRRGRVADEAKSKGPDGGGRGQRAPTSSGRGGILRVSLDKHSSEEQTSRKNPRGRGRGILVLPAHTDLTLTPEPGPQLGAMRGGMGLGRGRGGRGGGTRRLWDPNNPDKKPALVSSQQSQHASLQQALYLQQGGCGPLHFLDTDDETTGSPPIRQGEFFQNQQAAAMAYYKFQNSDNPYCYPLPANSPNTPPRYPYPYHIPYQIPGSNGMYPASITPFYGPYGQGGPGYPSPAGSGLTPEEAEVQTRGELGKLLRLADSQELQLSNLLSRERLSPEGLERMAQL
ncbi:hypothetical protein M9458_022253, partial [Cirrhinus mrigala]